MNPATQLLGHAGSGNCPSRCLRKQVVAPSALALGCNARRKAVVQPLALLSPSGGPTSGVPPSNPHAVWAAKVVRATVFATTLQFCAAASQSASASVGGGWGAGGGFGGSGGGGGGGGDGASSASGHASSPNVLGDIAEASDLVEEVLLLDVGGMKCGGCVGHVKKILESQPGVVAASVNLATETALVRVLVPRGSKAAAAAGTGQAGGSHLTNLGEQLAEVLSRASFPAQARAGCCAGAAAAAHTHAHVPIAATASVTVR